MALAEGIGRTAKKKTDKVGKSIKHGQVVKNTNSQDSSKGHLLC